MCRYSNEVSSQSEIIQNDCVQKACKLQRRPGVEPFHRQKRHERKMAKTSITKCHTRHISPLSLSVFRKCLPFVFCLCVSVRDNTDAFEPLAVISAPFIYLHMLMYEKTFTFYYLRDCWTKRA